MSKAIDAGLELPRPAVSVEQFVPTITPTMEEFKDFAKVIRDARAAHPEVGAIKVRPPAEWRARKTRRDYNDVGSIEIPAPIKQIVQTKTGAGVYEVLNVEQKPTTVADFAKLAQAQAAACPINKNDLHRVERKFWTNLLFNPSTYGADMQGTLMDADVPCWNLQKLPNVLDVIGESMPGINRPYLYFGMWKALFAWHVEDMDLYSINFLHFGEPKFWYVVPPAQAIRFETMLQGYFAQDYATCKQFLRHKSSLVSPVQLQKDSIVHHKIIQEAGEFVVTFPMAYHAGFNLGYNCAESVNFALEDWIPYGQKSVRCKCDSERAVINMDSFMYAYEMKKYGQVITANIPGEAAEPIVGAAVAKRMRSMKKLVPAGPATTTTTTTTKAKAKAVDVAETEVKPTARRKRKAPDSDTDGNEVKAPRKVKATKRQKEKTSSDHVQSSRMLVDDPSPAGSTEGVQTRRKRAKLTEDPLNG